MASVAAITHDTLATVAGLTTLTALTITGLATLFLLARLYDGRGFTEPTRSQLALSGQLYLVDAFPELNTAGPPHVTSSPLKLRKIAERKRLPVLHRIDPTTGQSQYLVITERHGNYMWVPAHGAANADGLSHGESGAATAPLEAVQQRTKRRSFRFVRRLHPIP